MGEIIDFAAYKAQRDFEKGTIQLPDGEVSFRCLVCKQRWKQKAPEGMKKVNCPHCQSTMLRYR